ncbi:hypothetical protein E4U53_001459, partial [Claviceps sorghi]
MALALDAIGCRSAGEQGHQCSVLADGAAALALSKPARPPQKWEHPPPGSVVFLNAPSNGKRRPGCGSPFVTSNQRLVAHRRLKKSRLLRTVVVCPTCPDANGQADGYTGGGQRITGAMMALSSSDVDVHVETAANAHVMRQNTA